MGGDILVIETNKTETDKKGFYRATDVLFATLRMALHLVDRLKTLPLLADCSIS